MNTAIETLKIKVAQARVAAKSKSVSFSNVHQGKNEADDAYEARLRKIRAAEAESRAANNAMIAALIELAAAEDAAQ